MEGVGGAAVRRAVWLAESQIEAYGNSSIRLRGRT